MNQTDPSSTDAHAGTPAAPAPGAAPDPLAQRLREAYLNEGMALLGEGVAASLIEQTGVELGLPAGPLALLDEVSLQAIDEALHRRLDGREPGHHGHDHARHGDHEHHDHGHHDNGHGGHDHDHGPGHEGHALSHRHEPASPGSGAWPPAPSMPESAVYVLEKMAHGYRRMGRAAGRGFYDYPADEPRALWPGLSAFERGASPIGTDDVRDRLLYAPAVEAARCVHDGLIGPAQADAGSLRDGVFPAWTGGVAHFIDHVGAARFVERADELAARYGERFRVPGSLRARAAGSPTR